MGETGELSATRGYTTTVVTPWGRETYQVWLTESAQGWVARIVTLPNRMWAMPGGREAVKFCGETAKLAESAAIRFIEEECIRTRRRTAPPIEPRDVWESPASRTGTKLLRPASRTGTKLLRPASRPETPRPRPAPRYPHRLPVRFGTKGPVRPGITANVSETGMFIITDQPAPVGSTVLIDVRFADGPLVLGGEVVWARKEQEPGRSLGFGVRLTERPREYVKHLKPVQ